MITTVTLNASIDKLYTINALAPYKVMRVNEVSNTAGGKGVNVAKVAALAGEQVTAMGFVGGHNGAYLKALLAPAGVVPGFTPVAGETRSCINIWDEAAGKSTELLEPGRPVTAAEVAAFLHDFEAMLPQTDIVTISGSMPQGCPPDLYTTLIAMAKRAGKRVLLDTSGETLIRSVEAAPYFIKPNTDEIAQLTGAPVTGTAALAAAAQDIRARGVAMVAVSLGADGVLVACEEGLFRGLTPDIPVVNTVGCGDSMVAGFAVGLARGLPVAQVIHLAVLLSTANALAMETGHFRQSDVDALQNQITVEKID